MIGLLSLLQIGSSDAPVNDTIIDNFHPVKKLLISTENIKVYSTYPSQCYLGEGPIWHEKRKSCFWVNIEDGILYEFSWQTSIVKTWKFPHRLSLAVSTNNETELILSLDAGLARFDLNSEELKWLVNLEPGKADFRCNDGACDSSGRLWIGTMSRNPEEEFGSLYCIDNDYAVTRKLEAVSISNGITWSIDNTKMYYIDSPTQGVQSFFFDVENGEITFEKNAIEIPPALGSPDGMAIDEEGMLWIAHWGGFGVFRWNPHDGKVLGKIELPVPNVSSCAFAGDDLDHLIITTAREHLTPEQLIKYPQSGDIFISRMKVKGVPQNLCTL